MTSNRLNTSKFPFQVKTFLVQVGKCKFQNKLAKLGATPSSLNFVIADLKAELKSISFKQIQSRRAGRQNGSAYKRQLKHLQKEKNELKVKIAKLESFTQIYKSPNSVRIDPSYNWIFAKNLNFLAYTKKSKEIKNLLGVEYRSNVYFSPNLLATESFVNRSNGTHYSRIKKDREGKEVIESIRFFFADLDREMTVEELNLKIDEFCVKPDVITQTSSGRYHLYWSLEHIEMPDIIENRLKYDKIIAAFRSIQKKICEHFDGDTKCMNPNRLLRVPYTFSYKPGRRPYKCKYLTMKTLEDALVAPNYKMDQFLSKFGIKDSEVDKISGGMSMVAEEVVTLADSLVDSPEDLLSNLYEYKQTKVDCNKCFEDGWEDALARYLDHFGLDRSYLSDNDVNVFRHIYKWRYNPFFFFFDDFRQISLKGKGNKYAELNESIDRIGRAGKRKNHHVLRYSDYVFHRNSDIGKKRYYYLSREFICLLFDSPQPKKLTKDSAKDQIMKDLYKRGKRNGPSKEEYQKDKKMYGLMFDAWKCLKVFGFSKKETNEILREKVKLSSMAAEAPCSEDYSNIPYIVDWYYRNC